MSTWTDNVTKLPWHWRGTLVSADGLTTLNLTDDDFLQNSIKIEESCSDTDKFALGGVITSSCSCTLIDIDQKFGGFDFTDAKLTLEVGLVYEDETEEWHTRGVYYCDKPSIVSEMIELTAYDAMDKFNRLWGNGEGGNIMSSDVLGAVSILAYECGVTFTQPDDWYLPNPALPNGNIEFAPQTSYRQLLSWLLEFSHGYGIIENDRLICKFIGEALPIPTYQFLIDGGHFWFGADNVDGLTMSPWLEGEDSYDGNLDGDFLEPIIFNSRISSEQITYTSVVAFPYDDPGIERKVGSDGYSLTIRENPLFTKATTDLSSADSAVIRLYNEEFANEGTASEIPIPGFNGLSFRPFEASVWCDPMVRCGQLVQISDINGNLYYAPITTMTIHGDGEIELACHAQTYAENKAELTEEKYSTVQDAVDQANTYTDSAIQTQMSSKASWFSTEEFSETTASIASLGNLSNQELSITTTSGKTPIAICGWDVSTRAVVLAECHLKNVSGNTAKIEYSLYNSFSSARTPTVTFYVLCI